MYGIAFPDNINCLSYYPVLFLYGSQNDVIDIYLL